MKKSNSGGFIKRFQGDILVGSKKTGEGPKTKSLRGTMHSSAKKMGSKKSGY